MNLRNTILSLSVLLVASAPLALAQGTYTQFNVPGANRTYAGSINSAGDIVGSYADSTGGTQGFILSGGTYTTGLNYPGTFDLTFFTGINDKGQVVGLTDSNPQLGFRYDIQSQTFTKIFYPGANTTVPLCINNSGSVAGYFGHFGRFGFELVGSTYIKIAPPNTTYSDVDGISDSGKLVGNVFLNNEFVIFSFDGKARKITIPNAPGATVTGISPSGKAIIGSYSPSSGITVGFIYRNKTLRTLQFPGATMTTPYGINDGGVVVGTFFGNGQGGFLWTPPSR